LYRSALPGICVGVGGAVVVSLGVRVGIRVDVVAGVWFATGVAVGALVVTAVPGQSGSVPGSTRRD